MKMAVSFLVLAVSSLALAPSNPGYAEPATVDHSINQTRTEGSFEQNRLAAIAMRVYNTAGLASKLQALGTGIFLGVDGLVLTNQHVAQYKDAQTKPGYRLEACLVSGGVAKPCLAATVIAVSENDDLALLRVSLPGEVPIVLRPDVEVMSEAEEVYARQSFASYLVPSLVYGRYVGYYPGWGADLYNMPIMPGSSGSAVFDLKNRLVGVVRARTTEQGTPFSVVIPIKVVRKFLADHGYAF